MTGSDDEFDDFLRRRKPVFRSPDDMFEPPAELDRVVLRQAREAIESERPLKVFRGPRWAAPVALAATMLLAVHHHFSGRHCRRSRRRCPKSPCRTSPSASKCRRPKRRWRTAALRSRLTTSAARTRDRRRGGGRSRPLRWWREREPCRRRQRRAARMRRRLRPRRRWLASKAWPSRPLRMHRRWS